jgi:hypothetical protein
MNKSAKESTNKDNSPNNEATEFRLDKEINHFSALVDNDSFVSSKIFVAIPPNAINTMFLISNILTKGRRLDSNLATV